MRYRAGAADQPGGVRDPGALANEHVQRVGGPEAGRALGGLAQPLRAGEAVAERRERRLGRLARAARPGPIAAPQIQAAAIALVAGEQLVAAVARERHGDLAAGEPADQRGRDLRRIGERLVVDRRQLGHQRQAVLRPDVELGVVGAEVRGDLPGERRLVVLRLAKADREGAHRLRARGLHQRDHGR